jgi:hypothetical protein
MTLKNSVGRAWTGFIWLREETSDGLFLNTVMNLRVPQNAGNFFAT